MSTFLAIVRNCPLLCFPRNRSSHFLLQFRSIDRVSLSRLVDISRPTLMRGRSSWRSAGLCFSTTRLAWATRFSGLMSLASNAWLVPRTRFRLRTARFHGSGRLTWATRFRGLTTCLARDNCLAWATRFSGLMSLASNAWLVPRTRFRLRTARFHGSGRLAWATRFRGLTTCLARDNCLTWATRFCLLMSLASNAWLVPRTRFRLRTARFHGSGRLTWATRLLRLRSARFHLRSLCRWCRLRRWRWCMFRRSWWCCLGRRLTWFCRMIFCQADR